MSSRVASVSVATYQGDALCVPAPHPPERAENSCHVAAWPVDWRCAVVRPRARGEIRAHISHDIWRAHTPVTSERARFCAAVHAPPRTHANHRTQEDACTPRDDHDQESGSRTCRDGCAKRARSWSRIAPKQPSGLRGSGDRTRATTNRDARSARRIGTEAVAPPDVPARYKTLPSPYRADQVHRRCPSHRAERPLADLEARNVLRFTASKDAWRRCPRGVQGSPTRMTPDRGEAARVDLRP